MDDDNGQNLMNNPMIPYEINNRRDEIIQIHIEIQQLMNRRDQIEGIIDGLFHQLQIIEEEIHPIEPIPHIIPVPREDVMDDFPNE